MTAVLRPATPADAEALTRLGERTFLETFVDGGFRINYPPDDLTQFLAKTYTPEAFAKFLGDPEVGAWLVEDASGPVAYATAGPNHLPHPGARPWDGELYRLYVAGQAQGLGLGRRLLETALGWLERKHPGPLWIGVWSGNLKAQKLYAHYGFQKAGEYEFPVGRTCDREFILRRS